MDAQPYIIALIPASVAIVTMAVQQVLGIIRAASDHGHELKLAHSQRVFEYKKSVLERNRAACNKLLLDLDNFGRICRDLKSVKQRSDALLADAERMRERVKNARHIRGDEGEALLAENEKDAEMITARTEDLSREMDELMRRRDEHRVALQQSADVIQLDYGALDIIGPFIEYMSTAKEEPDSAEATKAYKKCVIVMIA